MVKNPTLCQHSWKSHMDTQSKALKILEGKDFSHSRSWHCKFYPHPGSPTELRGSLGTCCFVFPTCLLRGFITSCWNFFQTNPTGSLFLILPPSSLSSNQLSSFFLLTALLKTVINVHSLHKEVDTLAWMKGCLHCSPMLWSQHHSTSSPQGLRSWLVFTPNTYSHAVP